jgi:hypothetical protein
MSGVDISGGREAGDWEGAADGCCCVCEVRLGAPSSGGSGMTRSKSLGFSQTDTRVILL